MILYFILTVATLIIAYFPARRFKYEAPGRFLVFLLLFHGLFLKPLVVALEIPSREVIESLVIDPLNIDVYWNGSLEQIIFYMILAISINLGSRRINKNYKTIDPDANSLCFNVQVIGFYYVVALIATIQFFLLNPDLVASGSKNSLATSDIAEYSGYGGLRLIESICFVLPFLLMVNIRDKYKIKDSKNVALACGLTHIAFLYFSDQRGAMLFSSLSWALGYSLIVSSISKKLVLYAIILTITLGAYKTVNRIQSGGVDGIETITAVVANFVGKNFIENSKTKSIIDVVDSSLGHMYGSTYIDALTILIPRSMFPLKSTVNLDTTIGNAVYGCESIGSCAVPPGLLAESYLNFGYIWVLISVIVVGFLIGYIDRLAFSHSLLLRSFYAMNMVYFGISALGSGIGSYLTQTIFHLCVFFLLYFSSRRTNVFNLPHPKIQVIVK